MSLRNVLIVLASLVVTSAAHAEREAGGRLAPLTARVTFASAADAASKALVLRAIGAAVTRDDVTLFENHLDDDVPSVCVALRDLQGRATFARDLPPKARGFTVEYAFGCSDD